MNFNLKLRRAPTPSTRKLVVEEVKRTKWFITKFAPIVVLLEHPSDRRNNPSPACLAIEVHACDVDEDKPRGRADLAHRLDARIAESCREEVMHFSYVVGIQRSERDDPFSVKAPAPASTPPT